MGLRDTYRLDEAKATDKGFKVDFYDDQGNEVGFVCVRYAGPSNKKFTAFRNNIMKPFERKVAQGNMSEAESDKLLQEAFIKGGIITDWSEDLPLTVDNFRTVMNESAPEVWRDIYLAAYNPKFFAADREAEAGN